MRLLRDIDEVLRAELELRVDDMDQYDLNEFRKQLGLMNDMGSLRQLMARVPGMGPIGMDSLAGIDVESEVRRIQGIIDSMTPDERRDPGLDRFFSTPPAWNRLREVMPSLQTRCWPAPAIRCLMSGRWLRG